MTQWLAPAGAHAPSFVDSLAITFFGGGVPDAMASASLLGHVKTEASRRNLAAPVAGRLLLSRREPGDPGRKSGRDRRVGAADRRSGSGRAEDHPQASAGPPSFWAWPCLPRWPTRWRRRSTCPCRSTCSRVGPCSAPSSSSPTMSARRARRGGQWLYGLGCGALTWVIRTWGGYPEGLAFAVLLMNAGTPLIDRWTRPRIFGRRRSGESLAARREGAQ